MPSPAHRSHYLKTIRATSEYRWFRLAVKTLFILQCTVGCLFTLGGIAVAIMVMIEAPYAAPMGIDLGISMQDAAAAGLLTLLYALFAGAFIIAVAFIIWTPLQMAADFLDMRIDAATAGFALPGHVAVPTAAPAVAAVPAMTPVGEPPRDSAPPPTPPAATPLAPALRPSAPPAPVRRQPTREEQATLLLARARAAFGRGEHADATRLLAVLRERFPDTKAAASTLE